MKAGRAVSGPGAPGRLQPAGRGSARLRRAGGRGGVQGKRKGNMASNSVWQGKMRRVSRQLTEVVGLRPRIPVLVRRARTPLLYTPAALRDFRFPALPGRRTSRTAALWLLGGGLGVLAWKALPALLLGRLQFGVLREGQGGQIAIGLSLSGTPGPEVLAALDATPITVFVPADSALVTDLSAAGHEVGLLARSSRDLAAGRARLTDLSGCDVGLLRSARFHLLTLLRVRQAGLRAVWPGRPGTVENLLANAEPGGLLDLTGLSATHIAELLARLRERGYQPGPVGALKGLRTETLRGLAQRLYRRVFDQHFDRRHGTVALTQRPRGLFRISRRGYDGPPLTLPGGDRFEPGTPAAELHIYSKRLVALAELSALTGLRGVQSSLYDVAQALEERLEFREVRLIYALTIFGGVLGTMGFQTEPLHDPRQARIMAVFFNLLRVLYGAKNTDSQVLLPGVIWMSREQLLERYGGGRRRAGRPERRTSGLG